jgi:hypothetical protein
MSALDEMVARGATLRIWDGSQPGTSGGNVTFTDPATDEPRAFSAGGRCDRVMVAQMLEDVAARYLRGEFR